MTNLRQAPGHTDMMVTPESIDAFMDANPLPPEPEVSADVLAAREYAKAEYPGDAVKIDEGKWDGTGYITLYVAGIAHERAKQSAAVGKLVGLLREAVSRIKPTPPTGMGLISRIRIAISNYGDDTCGEK